MRYRITIYFMIICLFTVPFHVYGFNTENQGRKENRAAFVPGELLVKYKAETYDTAKSYFQKKWGFETMRRFRSIKVDHVKLPQGMAIERALKIYGKEKLVEYAEPNFYQYEDTIPDDPYFEQLWGLDNAGQCGGLADADIDAPEAWNITTGSDDVVVAVIDSGLDYDHPEFAGNIWINPDEIADNGIDDDGNGYVDDIRGWDFIQYDNAPAANDPRGHGTHVAGIIAAGGNNTQGVAGVNWSAKIMALRFINALGTGTTTDAILAVEYANAEGADVINNSWGGGGFSQALKDVIDASPALVVCAAGNSGTDNDLFPHYPSSYASENILAVAASDSSDLLADFSNYGAVSVDVAAPGRDILSCAPGRQTVWLDDFDDGRLDGWLSGGKKKKLMWGLTDSLSCSGSYSLTESPEGDYINRAKSWIKGPVMNLSLLPGGKLEFMLTGKSQAVRDQLFVEVSLDDEYWTRMAVEISGVGYFIGVSGTLTEWAQASVDLEVYAGYAAVYFRFAFESDRSTAEDGWYIDDVALTAASSAYAGTEYQVRSGTSMAAPYVSGIAALVKSENPALTPLQIKEIIAYSTDALPSMLDRVRTGGRVNAYNALTY